MGQSQSDAPESRDVQGKDDNDSKKSAAILMVSGKPERVGSCVREGHNRAGFVCGIEV